VKNFFAGVVVTLLVLALGTFAYLRLGWAEARADLPPSSSEVSMMRSFLHASIRREAPNVSNPVPPTDENLIAGGKLYLQACAGCHGIPGKPFGGHGPILYPPIPELPVVGTDLTEAQVFFVAKRGIRYSGMFANEVWVKDADLWAVAGYIKRMNSLPPAVKQAMDQAASKVK